ncbi:MAG: hypothetical protein WCG93_01170 [Paludibacter sp.]
MKKIATILFASVFSVMLMAQTQNETTTTTTTTNQTVTLVKPRSYFGMALGVSASTNGLGVNVTTALNKRVAIRLGYEKVDMTFNDAFSYNMGGQALNVSPTWKAGGLSAILDLYLIKGFYVSGGVVLTDMNIAATLKSGNSIKIGDIEFKPDELGELGLTVKPLNKMAPYAAIGFGRNISRDHRLAMSLEVGAYYMGSYVLGLTGTKLFEANGDPANQASLNKLNETLKSFSWSGYYPVVKLGLSYKFLGQNK